MKRHDFSILAIAFILALGLFAMGAQYGKRWAIHNAKWDGWTGSEAGVGAEYAISFGDNTHGWEQHSYTIEEHGE